MLSLYVRMLCFVVVVAAVLATADGFSVRQKDFDAAVKLVEELKNLEQISAAEDNKIGKPLKVDDINENTDGAETNVDDIDDGDVSVADTDSKLRKHLKSMRDGIKHLLTEFQDRNQNLIEKIQEALSEMNIIVNDDNMDQNGGGNGGPSRRGLFDSIVQKLNSLSQQVKNTAYNVVNKAKDVGKTISDAAKKASDKAKGFGTKIQNWSQKRKTEFINLLSKLFSG